MSKEIIDLLEKARAEMLQGGNWSINYKEGFSDAIDQALTLFKQQPTKPTSLGNTIRRIADNSKCNETDKNIIHQAADRLDAWWKYIGELKEQIKAKDELLFAYESVRAPKQPTAGEFTKEIRTALKRYIMGQVDFAEDWIFHTLSELCDRLDRAEAINKDLLEACDKVRDWLDTSSLQQILVHHTEDTRRHALIMGIASNLERLEAAIAKAKKEG